MTITVSEIQAASAGARAAQNPALAKLLDDCAEALASAERGLENMTEHANEIDLRRFTDSENTMLLLEDARRRAQEWHSDLVRLYKKVRVITRDTERALNAMPRREVPDWAQDESR